MTVMKAPDPDTERALRDFLARVPVGLPYERAILYGSRARGDHRPDSDADLALIMSEHADDWPTLSALSGLAFDVFLDTGILIQPVPISAQNWADPERFPRPSFLRNVAREGIDL
jgi:predicted nucleotidyltransferase